MKAIPAAIRGVLAAHLGALALLCLASSALAAAPVPVAISFQPALAGRPIPARFLGLSFEVGSLTQLAGYAHRGDFVQMLRSLGPGVLRFGGITADQNIAWSDAQTPRPAWASGTIGPAQMTALGELARASGWSVLLTIGMAHFEPQAAAREIISARHALGSSLLAIEFGNEPDAYGRHGFRPEPWGLQAYEEEVSIAREALGPLGPTLPVAGPDVSGSGLFPSWGYAEAVTQQPLFLTGHHYPLGCTHQPPPSSELLLSPALRGREAQSLATYVSVAAAQHLSVRIDETNSVSCGGVTGVSDTFAGALWAAGYIAQAASAGAIGINLHGHPNNCSGYSPLCAPDPTAIERGELRAQPDWYSLLLTRSLIGWRPMPTAISLAPASPGTTPAVGSMPAAGTTPAPAPPTEPVPATAAAPDLVASGFSGHQGAVKLLLSDDDPPGSAPLALSVNVGPGLGKGAVERMTAPSPQAKEGVRLTGRTLAADGIWRPARPERVPDHDGIVTVTLQPSSAALLTVERPPPAKHRRRAKH